MKRVSFAIIAVLLATAAPAGAGQNNARAVQNLRAFAKLYGYVRFFHPTDEAGAIDWDAFAAFGANRVLDCADAKTLRLALAELFAPIAPEVQVYGAGTKARPVKLPGDSATCQPVFWRHFGVALSSEPSAYQSRRTAHATNDDFVRRSAYQEVELPSGDSARELTLRVRVRARTNVKDPDQGPRVLAVSYPAGEQLAAFKTLRSSPIAGDTWQTYEVTAPVEPDCRIAAFGISGGVDSEVWADDFEAWTGSEDTWTRLDVKDQGFEDSVSLMDSKDWWFSASTATKSADGPFAGRACLLIAADTSDVFRGLHVSPAEYVDKPLDQGLRCRVPLCLWSQGGHTLPRGDSAGLARLQAALPGVVFDSLADPAREVRLGDVVIVWNVMQHFYPYFDVVRVDWDTVLTSALAEALGDTSRLDFLYTLRRMGAALSDGHVSVSDPVVRAYGSVPAHLEKVEGCIVVVSAPTGPGLRQADVLLSVNGRSADDLLDEQVRYSSGSPQQRRARALRMLVRGPKSDTFRFRVKRGKDTVAVSGVPVALPAVVVPPDQGDSIRKLAPGIWYVDLNRAPMPAIDSVMDSLAGARGVVFDLRGYPYNNHEVICHLLTGREDRTETWMHIPKIVYPDRERIAGWNKYGWQYLQPKMPRIAGKVVFLTDGTAISYAESFLGYIEGFKLAEIVGQPTAGTNGNVNPIRLPGGYVFNWTGMKVLKHDGSQHHLVGIQPTVPLERTLAAVRAGRDEYIEQALRIIGP